METIMSKGSIHRFGFSMLILTAHLLAGCAAESKKPSGDGSREAETAPRTNVVAGCATCIFDMPGVTGCKLAVKIDGAPYLVTGADMDDLGDAHAWDGLCNTARDAVVEGKIEGDRFVATHFKLTSQ